jgi:nicotinamidase-related amidase
VLAEAPKSVLIVVDVQPKFLAAIWEKERVVKRSEFLLRISRLLGVPAVATEQNVDRMGGTHPNLVDLLSEPPMPKMSFSCAKCEGFERRLAALKRKQAVIVGIESHICVCQTAHHLLANGFEVIVCEDAVSARSEDRHKNGIERIRDAGATIADTESVAYEWLGSADNPNFREALEQVKRFSA